MPAGIVSHVPCLTILVECNEHPCDSLYVCMYIRWKGSGDGQCNKSLLVLIPLFPPNNIILKIEENVDNSIPENFKVLVCIFVSKPINVTLHD